MNTFPRWTPGLVTVATAVCLLKGAGAFAQDRVIQKATDADMAAGVNDTRFVTPLKLSNRLSTLTNNLAGALTNHDTRTISFKGGGMWIGTPAGNGAIGFTNGVYPNQSYIYHFSDGFLFDVDQEYSGGTQDLFVGTNHIKTEKVIAAGTGFFGSAAGVTNIGPQGLLATNSGTVGQVPKRINATQWYWANDDNSGGGGGTTNLVNNGNQVLLTNPTGTTNLMATGTDTVLFYADGTRAVEIDSGGIQVNSQSGAQMFEGSASHLSLTATTIGFAALPASPGPAEAGLIYRRFSDGRLMMSHIGLSSLAFDSSTNYYITAESGGTPGSAGDFKLRDGTVRTLAGDGSGVTMLTLFDSDASNSNLIRAPDNITTSYAVIVPAAPATGFRRGVNSSGVVTESWTDDGVTLTNVLEKNVVVTTNGWGVSVVNFALGTQLLTNMTGNLTLTGISGFVSSNLNWQTIALNPDGATRTLTVPADWWVSGGFTNGTLAAVTNGTRAKLSIEAVIGVYTNAALEHWQ